MLRAGFMAAAIAIASHPAAAAPIALVFDDDLALRAAGYDSLASILLPISRGLTGDYAISFDFEPDQSAQFGGFFGGVRVAVGDINAIPAGSAIGFRLVVATEGEAEHTVNDIPAAETLSGVVDPVAIALLVPAVQQAREAPDTSGDGPTCEPPPELVCESPPGPGPFQPVDWLVFEFGETLLNIDLAGSFAFRPASAGFGPNDMAVEIHYLRLAAVDEPAALILLGAGVLAAFVRGRGRSGAARDLARRFGLQRRREPPHQGHGRPRAPAG